MDLSALPKLHGPCAGLNAAGDNLEYDSRFLEMIRLSESRPEIQYGSTILAAREPDWLQLLDSCLAIANSTRDLRVAVHLVESVSRLYHWAGLAAGLELLEKWIVLYWDCIFPLLDEEEQGDPTQRLSVLSHLVSDECLLKSIALIPIADHRSLGQLTLRDYNSIISGSDLASSKIKPAELDIIFGETEADTLATRRYDVQRAQVASRAINKFLMDKVGSARWSGDALTNTLAKVDKVLRTHGTPQRRETLHLHSSKPDAIAETDRNSRQDIQAASAATELAATEASNSFRLPTKTSNASVSSQILSRAEATIAIDHICSYFEQHEPASPVPLILQRAKRLIPMSFVEILHELAPKESHEFLQHLVCSK